MELINLIWVNPIRLVSPLKERHTGRRHRGNMALQRRVGKHMWRYIGKLTPREDGHAKSGKDRSCAAICQGFTSHLVSPVAEETRTDHLLEGLKCTCLQASWFPIFTLQSCVCHWVLSLCDPMDCSLPGSSVLGNLQARMLEWVAMSSARGSFQTRDQTSGSCISRISRQILWILCHENHLGSPELYHNKFVFPPALLRKFVTVT